MEMVALSWVTTVLVGVVIVVLLVVAVVLLPAALPLKLARFYCPWARRNAVVRYLTDDGSRSGRLISCSALEDPTTPPCGASCLSEGGLVDLQGADPAVPPATRV